MMYTIQKYHKNGILTILTQRFLKDISVIQLPGILLKREKNLRNPLKTDLIVFVNNQNVRIVVRKTKLPNYILDMPECKNHGSN